MPSMHMQAYKSYVKTILKRTNTYTGLLYSEEPAIFAWELANEPRTSNNYESSRGLNPGGIIKPGYLRWQPSSGAWTRTKLQVSRPCAILSCMNSKDQQ